MFAAGTNQENNINRLLLSLAFLGSHMYFPKELTNVQVKCTFVIATNDIIKNTSTISVIRSLIFRSNEDWRSSFYFTS